MRTAAIVIDNFLESHQWQGIQEKIASGNYLNVSDFEESKNSPYGEILIMLSDKLKEIDLWQDHWESTLSMWSFINTLPPGIDRESSSNNDGYHSEFGGFVYYAHPSWNSSWGGHLKFKNCDIEKIEPTPNRFVWINPAVWHGIEVVNSGALHNRITVVGWPEGCLEYQDATLQINIHTEG